MDQYKHILLALELDPKADKKIIKKASELVNQYAAELTLVHAVEYVSNYGAAYGVTVGIDIEETLVEEATKSIRAVGKSLNIPQNRQIVHVGPAKQVILDEAKRIGVELIVLGSHGRHGVRLLLGSTANAVLHGAECDVLAVRLQD